MLNPKVKRLCQAANYAALTTLFPNGQPQTHIMWVDCDDNELFTIPRYTGPNAAIQLLIRPLLSPCGMPTTPTLMSR